MPARGAPLAALVVAGRPPPHRGGHAALGRVAFTQDAHAEHLYLLYYDLSPGAPVVADIRPPIMLLFVPARAAELRAPGPARGRTPGATSAPAGSRSPVTRGTSRDRCAESRRVRRLQLRARLPDVWFRACSASASSSATPARPPRPGWGGGDVHRRRAGRPRQRAGDSIQPVLRHSALTARGRPRFEITANGSLHQVALPLRRGAAVEPDRRTARDTTCRTVPRRRPVRARALVVGRRDSGNDVAVLLDHGAEQVDAVEIDPVILDSATPPPSRRALRLSARARDRHRRPSAWRRRPARDVRPDRLRDARLDDAALRAVHRPPRHLRLHSGRCSEARAPPPPGRPRPLFHGARDVHRLAAGRLSPGFGEAPLVDGTDRALFNRIYMAGPAFAAAGRGGAPRGRRAACSRGCVRTVELPRDDWPYPVSERARDRRLLPVDDGGRWRPSRWPAACAGSPDCAAAWTGAAWTWRCSCSGWPSSCSRRAR